MRRCLGGEKCISTYAMADGDSLDGLGTLLRRLVFALDGDVQAIYDEHGLAFRPRYFPIVRALIAVDGLTVSQLATRIGISQPAVTQTLAEMRRDGLVSVDRATDRRARAVRLTQEGHGMARRLEPIWRAIGIAATQLDGELSAPLGIVLREALERLRAMPFRDRVRGRLEP